MGMLPQVSDELYPARTWSTATMLSFSESMAVMKCCTVSATATAELLCMLLVTSNPTQRFRTRVLHLSADLCYCAPACM